MSLVMPHLECCVQLWSPQDKKDKEQLKGIDSAEVTKAIRLEHFFYEKRLKELGLFSPENRRPRDSH